MSGKLYLAAAAVLLIASPEPAAADPTGTWLRATGTSQIRISKCGNALCGKVVWLKEPNDPATGKPKTDTENPDAAKRNNPLIGTTVILGMTPTGKDGQYKGQVYKADEGRTYTGYLQEKGPKTIVMEGCALAGIICKEEELTRVK